MFHDIYKANMPVFVIHVQRIEIPSEAEEVLPPVPERRRMVAYSVAYIILE